MRRMFIATLLAVLIATPSAQNPTPGQFEVVSIKPSPPESKTVEPAHVTGDRLIMRNQPTRGLVWFAYEPIEGREIVGGPDWVHKGQNYDVEAKALGPITTPQGKIMAREVLADRFKLRAHYEKQERQVLALMVAKPEAGLPKGLVRSSFDCDTHTARMRAGLVAASEIPHGTNGSSVCFVTGGSVVESGAGTMDELAGRLTRPEQPMVVNRTGLEGRYEFRLRYALSLAVNPIDDDKPPLDVALQQQLGLRLIPQRISLEMLVIDSIEHPTQN